MQNRMFRKSLVLGIILLFIGTSVIPGISENIIEQDDMSSLEKQSSDVISDVVYDDITENNDFNDFEKTVVDNNEESDESENDRSYDWPTFQHDMQRTGYSSGVGDIDSPSVRWRFFSEEPFTWNSVIGDIDNDNENEIVICDISGTLFCIDGSTGLEEWSTNNAGCMRQPSLYDVDDDGDIEIVGYGDGENGDDPGVYCLDGSTGSVEWSQLNFPYPTDFGWCAFGDINNDGVDEIVVTLYIEGIYLLNGETGAIIDSNEANAPGISTIASIYDILGDAESEIILNIEYLRGYNSNLDILFNAGECDYTPTLIADIDDDSYMEMVYAYEDVGAHPVRCIYHGPSGIAQKWIFYSPGDVRSSPAAADVDDDGDVEVIVFADGEYLFDGAVYCIDGSTGLEEWNCTIPGFLNWESSLSLADIDNDGIIEIIVGPHQPDDSLYCIDGETGDIDWQYTSVANPDQIFNPIVGDVNNDGLIEIISIINYNYGPIYQDGYIYCLQNDFGDQPPNAIADPVRVNIGETKNFFGGKSWDPDGTVDYYRWDWTNDGIWDTEWLNSSSISHIFNQGFIGNYSLEVKDNDGLTDSCIASIRIDEPPPITWEKEFFNYYSFVHFEPTSDNGLIFIGKANGNVFIVKTDVIGNEEWNVSIFGKDPYCIKQTSTGDFIGVGQGYEENNPSEYDMLLIKVNSNGVEQWNNTYGGSDSDGGRHVIEDNNGDYIVTGRSKIGSNYEIALWKIDSNGNLIWMKTQGVGTGNSVAKTNDGGYIIAGGRYLPFPESDWSACVIKTNSNGDKQWEKTYCYDFAKDICRTNDNCYAITGYNDTSYIPREVYLIKIDNTGNTIWSKTYGEGSGKTVQQNPDGNYFIGGTNYGWDSQGKIFNIDQNGDLEWSVNVPGSMYNHCARKVGESWMFLTQKSGHPWFLKYGWLPPTSDPGGPYYSNPGYQVIFDGTGSHDNDEYGMYIDQYDWKLFDGDSWHNDTGPHPSHNYTTEGEYTVSLRVWDDEGDNNTASDIVYINYLPHPPTADIRAGEPYIGMEKDELIQFNASWSHDNDNDGCCITRYDWKFFDGDTWHNDLGVTPTHIYIDPGEYTVSVRVHDDEGITDNDETTVLVYPYRDPDANAGGPYNGMEDTELIFDASNSYDPDEFHINSSGFEIVEYRWDFNDDDIWDTSWLDFTDPYYQFTYFYEYYGVAQLEVKDDEGNTSIGITSIHVESYKDPTSNPGGPYFGFKSVPFTFNGGGSHDNDQNGDSITQYKWKYYAGDTWHIDGPTPTHTYISTGIYSVTLNVTDNDPYGHIGYDEASTTITIEDYQDPTADAGGPYNGMSYNQITFDASASYDNDENGCCIESYRWDWTNDGSWDTGWLTDSTATHTYLLGFTGTIRVQVKDNDPGGNQGYDTDTASITIIGQPPTADFSIISTNNPSIFNFDGSSSIDPRPGFDYRDLTYSWDMDNDGSWDKTGSYSSAGIITWSYLTSGQKTIKLKVENPDGTDTHIDTVAAFNYNDINMQCSNPNFFLSYPGSSIPPLKNRYYFTTPSGVFTKVTFKIGSHTVTDTSGNTWEGILEMSRGSPGNSVIIKGYSGSNVVWTETISTKIISTPGWFEIFVSLSNPSVSHYNNYSGWKMTVRPVTAGLGWEMPDLPDDSFGGKYGVDAYVKLPDKFIIDSSEPFVVTKQLASGGASFEMDLKDRKVKKIGGTMGVSAGAGFSADISVAINPDELYLVGFLSLYGYGSVSFDVPLIHLIVFDAGLSFSFGGRVDVDFYVAKFADDGITFCPSGYNSKASLQIDVSGSIYAQVVLGLGRVEGGVSGSGKLTVTLPSMNKKFRLTVDVFAKASILWGIEIWRGDWNLIDKTWYLGKALNGENPLVSSDDLRSMSSRNIDIPCLKGYNYGSRSRGMNLLADNVGELAVPKIVLTEVGEGVAVWSDISLVDDGFQSDIFWSVFDGTNWGAVENTNTSGRCEFDPELVLVNDVSGEYVVLTFLAVDHVINETTDPDTFYAGSRIHTALWNKNNGWLFEGENILIYGGTVNTRSMFSDGQGNIFMTYLVDTDCDPWESGIGKIYVVNGTVAGDEVNWMVPVKIRELDSIKISLQPQVSFVDDSVGCVVYSRWNGTTGLNETVVVPTVSGISGFSNVELLVNSTDQTVRYVSSFVDDDKVVVFWIQNTSEICQAVVDTDPVLNNWVIADVEVVYSNQSIVYLKPVIFEDKQYLLFQMGDQFIPFVLEKLPGDVWGNLRQVTLNERFSLGQLDGDSNGVVSMMAYLRDTPLVDWLIGQWRFNEGESDNASDSSGFGNDGIIFGNTSWVEQTNETFDPDYGYALQFNDSSGYVEIPYDTSLVVSDEFTITCWANLNSSTSGSNLLGVNGSWQFREVNGKLEVKLWRINGQVTLSDIADIPLDNWTFINLIYNHGVLKVSVRPNGFDNTLATFNLGDYSLVDSGNSLVLGGFMGCLDEVWLFCRDISLSEVDSIWFSPFAILGSLHDVVVQHLPSFASFSFGTPSGRGDGNVTTEDLVEFTGSPSGFNFEWDFGDGTFGVGVNVSHQYSTAGLYSVVCNATNVSTGVVTPMMQTVSVVDSTPPVFGGLGSVVAGGNCNVSLGWSAAVDTGPFVMYYGFLRNSSGSYNYSSPCFVTDNISYTVEGLAANETYYFLVRAVDAAGNMENNMVELSTVVMDLTPPLFDGVNGLYNLSNQPGSILLEWDEADDLSPPITYNIYMATSPNGHDFDNPVNSTNLTWIMIRGLDLDNESFYFVVRAVDVWGNEDNNIVEMGTPGRISVNLSLSVGWNLITFPFMNDFFASDLVGFIPGLVMVSWLDALNQSYDTFIVGGPPGFDFSIRDGFGYFVLVNQSSFLNLSGYRIGSVFVPLFSGWNLIGWYDDRDIWASSLGGNISNCSMVSWFNGSSQSYDTFIVGGSPQFDFTITAGMGVFVLIDAYKSFDKQYVFPGLPMNGFVDVNKVSKVKKNI